MSIKLTPKCTTNDYSFLSGRLSQRTFYLRTEYEHVREKGFGGLSIKECYQQFKAVYQSNQDFQKSFKSHQLFDKERIYALNKIFDETISNMTTFRSLMVEIQNEYLLIISALQNKLDEKAFLKTKIQQLVGNLATPDQKKEQQEKYKEIHKMLEFSLKMKALHIDYIRTNEMKFVDHICALFDKQLAEACRSKSLEKRRKELLMLGKWNFLKDWLNDRQHQEKIIAELYLNLTTEVFLFDTAITL